MTPCNRCVEISARIIVVVIIAIVVLGFLSGCQCKRGSDAITEIVCTKEG